MSSVLETVGPRSGAAPLTYRLAEAGTVDLQSVFAHFDGTSASASWRPALTIRSQNGTILARVFPSDTLAAGDTADVTYAPFLRGEAASSGGSGIQFEVDNTGAWLHIFTTGDDGQQNGVWIATETVLGRILLEAADGDVELRSGRDINLVSEGDLFARSNGTTTLRGDLVTIQDTGSGVRINGATLLQLAGQALFVTNLPTLDPGASGQLWNDANTLKVSP